MKWFIFVLVLSSSFFVWANNPNLLSTEELVELSAYIGEQIELDEVDCSNIRQFIEDYLKLSTANQLYLQMSAHRLASSVEKLLSQAEDLNKSSSASTPVNSEPSPYSCVTGDVFGSTSDGDKDPKKDIKQDIECARHLISENEWILSEQAEVIKEVLPTCLNQTTPVPQK